MKPHLRWIDFGKRLERALTKLHLSYGTAAEEAEVSKAAFYRSCRGQVPSADNYVKLLVWLKNSQRRIGRQLAVAAAQHARRRPKDAKVQAVDSAGRRKPSGIRSKPSVRRAAQLPEWASPKPVT